MQFSNRIHRCGNGISTCRFLATVVCLALITSCGGGSPSNPFDGGDATQAPPPPVSSISATGTDGGIVVDWFGSIAATSYNVYWSDSPGVSQQSGTRTTVSLPPATITGLSNGTTYYVIVAAANEWGESQASIEVQAVAMLQPPPAVIGVQAEPGDGDATIEWFEQADADSYSVFFGTDPAGGGTEMAGATSPVVVTGLTNSETYYLSVAGNNAAGQGAASQVVEATPVAAVPGWIAQAEINTPFSGLANDLELEDVAINDSGVAAALWTSSEGFFGSVKRIVINHTASGAWGEQFILANAGSSASVTVTSAGDIHVASDDGATIRARRYTNDAWSDATVIRNSSTAASSFGVGLATDDQGNVFLCWVEDTFPAGTDPLRSTHSLWVSRFDANTEAWGAAELISTSLSWIRSPGITAGAANTAIVAWLQDSVEHDPSMQNPPDRRVVYASRYDGLTWQSAAVVGRNDLVDFDNGDELALDSNADGAAVVMWTQARSATGTPDAFQVEAVRFDAQLSQWSAPETIVDGTTQAFVPNVTLDGANGSLAAWINGANTVVSGSTFDPVASLWGAVTEFPTDILGASEPYGIDGDEASSLVIAWAKDFQVPKGVFVRRQDAGSGDWGATAHLGGRVGDELLFEMSGSGHAILVTKTRVTQRESLNNVVYGMIYTP